jgi:hypothetical protein
MKLTAIALAAALVTLAAPLTQAAASPTPSSTGTAANPPARHRLGQDSRLHRRRAQARAVPRAGGPHGAPDRRTRRADRRDARGEVIGLA